MAGTLKISEVGKYNDGVKLQNNGSNDGPAIQRAIIYCLDNDKDILEFDTANQTYIVNSELIVNGSGLTINGNNCILRKTARCSSNMKGAFFTIEGESGPAQNVYVNNLNLVFIPDITRSELYTNGFGICNADDVTLTKCTVYGAPQTSFAVVATHNKDIDNVLLDSCTGANSKKHTFRLNAMDGSKYFKAKMKSCIGKNTLEKDTSYSIPNKKEHLLVNVTNKLTAKECSQVIHDCSFDNAGAYVTGPCPYVEFKNCYFPWERGTGAEKANVITS